MASRRYSGVPLPCLENKYNPEQMKKITGTVNWGIIGCGDVCEVKSGPAFNKIPESKLVAVMRRNEARAKDFARRHQVPKYYTDAADLVNDREVNAIYIATPPSSHEQYTEMALKAGKPVYVEKPVTISVSSLKRMIETEKQYQGRVSVAHYRRALPLFNNIKQLVTEGAVGKVKLILLKTLQPRVSNMITQTEDNWRVNPSISGGGLFHDLSPHQLDILYWIFNKPVSAEVMAGNQGKQNDAPDITLVLLRFEDDIYFSGTWNFNVAPSATAEQCEIIGDEGRIRFCFFGTGAIELITEGSTQIIEQEYPAHIQQPHIHRVVKFFRGEGPNPCTLEDALVTMRIMDMAVQFPR
jgi:1,5-anhydro-D-fructose reductase (1,5-anhydro-D-mannitol-forming)